MKIHRYILQNIVTEVVHCRTFWDSKRFLLLLIKGFHGQITWEIEPKEVHITFFWKEIYLKL